MKRTHNLTFRKKYIFFRKLVDISENWCYTIYITNKKIAKNSLKFYRELKMKNQNLIEIAIIDVDGEKRYTELTTIERPTIGQLINGSYSLDIIKVDSDGNEHEFGEFGESAIRNGRLSA